MVIKAAPHSLKPILLISVVMVFTLSACNKLGYGETRTAPNGLASLGPKRIPVLNQSDMQMRQIMNLPVTNYPSAKSLGQADAGTDQGQAFADEPMATQDYPAARPVQSMPQQAMPAQPYQSMPAQAMPAQPVQSMQSAPMRPYPQQNNYMQVPAQQQPMRNQQNYPEGTQFYEITPMQNSQQQLISTNRTPYDYAPGSYYAPEETNQQMGRTVSAYPTSANGSDYYAAEAIQAHQPSNQSLPVQRGELSFTPQQVSYEPGQPYRLDPINVNGSYEWSRNAAPMTSLSGTTSSKVQNFRSLEPIGQNREVTAQDQVYGRFNEQPVAVAPVANLEAQMPQSSPPMQQPMRGGVPLRSQSSQQAVVVKQAIAAPQQTSNALAKPPILRQENAPDEDTIPMPPPYPNGGY